MRRRLHALRVMIAITYEADRGRALATLGITIADAVLRAVFAVWLKLITDGAVTHDIRLVVAGAVGLGVDMCLLGYVSLWRVNITTHLSERTAFLVDRRLVELSAAIPTIEHFERSDYLDEMALLRSQRDSSVAVIWALSNNLLTATSLATTLVLLARIHPLMLLLPVFAIPAMLASGRAATLRRRAIESTADRSRAAQQLFAMATAPGPGKELRIFGLQRQLADRHRVLSEDVVHAVHGASLRGGVLTSLAYLVFALGLVASLALVVVLAVRPPHTATVGDVVLLITLADELRNELSQAAGTFSALIVALDTVRRYLWLVDYAKQAAASPADTLPAPQRIDNGIRFEGVAFRYPGTEVDVLSGVDLHIPAGSTLAIVGENGAGKTTLVKLLCRLYEPSAGRITVDGTDIARFDVAEWRQRISSGFQDFAQLHLLARETVGVGALAHIDDATAVLAALQRAHAADVPPTLPRGLETQVGTTFEGGVDLSVGQWQKLALGRAMMREAPLLLVLDEPTASLDAQTEHALFERYAAAARDTALSSGGITVLVSHRFSTIRMADLIVVVDGGRIVQVGAHSELVRTGGLYASLYELQARAYR